MLFTVLLTSLHGVSGACHICRALQSRAVCKNASKDDSKHSVRYEWGVRTVVDTQACQDLGQLHLALPIRITGLHGVKDVRGELCA